MNKEVGFSTDLNLWLKEASDITSSLQFGPRIKQRGKVISIGDGVAFVSGLKKVRLNELVIFETGVEGMVMSIETAKFGCILLGSQDGISAGSVVVGSGQVARTKVGDELLGRILDPLGKVLDNGPELEAKDYREVERQAPPIVDRDLVSTPLQTGITVIDAMIPLGRGQRELIIGDRGTGKTTVAIDTIINQRDTDVICIYVAIGQKSSSIKKVIQAITRNGKIKNCIFVAALADSSPGMQWLAPYGAFAMAEYFVDQGRDVLVVLDDMNKHAATYRELALLLGYIPGREAYPSDIFYIHARLLERATQMSTSNGGGSLTALPIVETQSGNLSSYIPTNLISITDGQIYLEPKLFNEGLKPAVNVGLSVSRVGGKTQVGVIRNLVKSLKIDFAQFQELELFTRFSSAMDEHVLKTIRHGRRIRAVLKQRQYNPVTLGEQICILFALKEKLLDRLNLEDVEGFKNGLASWIKENAMTIISKIIDTDVIKPEDREILLDQLTHYAKGFSSYMSKEDEPSQT